MYYYCSIKDNYILSIGVISTYAPNNDGYISKERYLELLAIYDTKPTPPDGFDYRLKENLTWELYELPIASEDETDEIPAEEALAELVEVLQ